MLHVRGIGMDTPATLADALSALNAANVRTTELHAEVATLNELLNEASATANERNALKAELGALNAKNTELAQQLAGIVNSVKSVDEQAAAVVAAAGHPPVELTPNPDTVAKNETLAERLKNVTDQGERTRIRHEFFNSLK